MSSLRRYLPAVLLLDGAAHLLLIMQIGPPALAAWALIAAAMMAPGLVLVPVLLAEDRRMEPWPQRLLLGSGAGFALFTPVALLVSYLPGPMTLWLLLLPFDLLVIGGALWGWRRTAQRAPDTTARRDSPWTVWPTVALLSVLALTGYFRLANLDYAELQGDEAKVVMHGVAAVQGDDDVLFVHRRGPADVLQPAAMATLNTPLTEAVFRLPFAAPSIVVVGLIFLLGQAVRGTMAGWIAGLLLASEGLFIAFARIVQYQASIHLSAVGTLYVLFLLATLAAEEGERLRPRLLRNYLLLAALFFTTGLLAHYEAIVVALPALYLLWRVHRNGVSWPRLGRAMLLPLALAIVATAAFYVPFFLDPRFQATAARYSEKVVGDFQRFFDHFPLLVTRGSLYNLHGTFWIMLLLLALYPAVVYWRTPSRTPRLIGLAGTIAMLALLIGVVARGETQPLLTPMVTALFILIALVAPAADPGERMCWLWFGPAMFLSVFLIQDPNLHFYIFFAPWALIVALVVDSGRRGLEKAIGFRPAQVVVGLLLALFLVPRTVYAQQMFIDHRVEIQRNWTTQTALPAWMRATDPAGHPIFGFPHNSGWKTIGVLYARGELTGSYSTNIRDWVSSWYTRSAEYCEETGDLVIIETVERPEDQADLFAVMGDQYSKQGEVYVGDRLGIEIYGRNGDAAAPVVRYQAEDFADDFDNMLADATLHPVVPDLDPALDSVYYRFGDVLSLTGYRLHRDTAAPGDSLSLLLRWELLAEPPQDYALFNQVLGENAHKVGQRDTALACSAGPVVDWDVGEAVVGHYRIPLEATAAAGEYPLFFGLYGRADGERLPVFDADGNPVGDALVLSQIEIEETPAIQP